MFLFFFSISYPKSTGQTLIPKRQIWKRARAHFFPKRLNEYLFITILSTIAILFYLLFTLHLNNFCQRTVKKKKKVKSTISGILETSSRLMNICIRIELQWMIIKHAGIHYDSKFANVYNFFNNLFEKMFFFFLKTMHCKMTFLIQIHL